MRMLDIARHAHDSMSILNWMLAEWTESPNEVLVIITEEDDVAKLDNRIRVRLSEARKMLKNSKRPFKKFGFESQAIPWTDHSKYKFGALILRRIVHVRHNISNILATDSPLEGTKL